MPRRSGGRRGGGGGGGRSRHHHHGNNRAGAAFVAGAVIGARRAAAPAPVVHVVHQPVVASPPLHHQAYDSTPSQPLIQQSYAAEPAQKEKKAGGLFCCLFVVYVVCVLIFAPWNSSFEPADGFGERETYLMDPSNVWWERISAQHSGLGTSNDIVLALMNERPPSTARVVTDSGHVTLPSYGFEARGYHMNQRSEATITWENFNYGVRMYVIKGENNMQRFRDGSTSSWITYLYGTEGTLEYTIPDGEDDVYYFVVSSEVSFQTNTGDFSDHILMASYDISGAVETCVLSEHSGECEVAFEERGSKQVVILDMGDVPRGETNLVLRSYGRQDYYFTVFLVPAAGVLVLAICAGIVAKKKQQKAVQQAMYPENSAMSQPQPQAVGQPQEVSAPPPAMATYPPSAPPGNENYASM